MKIYLGSDHRGFELKERLKAWLSEQGRKYEDMGPFEYDKDDDYPDFAKLVGEKVAVEPGSKGILICGSGVGAAVAANKIKGIRSGTMFDPEQVKASVADENTNIIGLSNDYTSKEKNMEIVKAFLESKFSGAERHVRRVGKIKNLES